MVVNRCFEGLEGRMGLNRMREFIPKAGKKMNERLNMLTIILQALMGLYDLLLHQSLL